MYYIHIPCCYYHSLISVYQTQHASAADQWNYHGHWFRIWNFQYLDWFKSMLRAPVMIGNTWEMNVKDLWTSSLKLVQVIRTHGSDIQRKQYLRWQIVVQEEGVNYNFASYVCLECNWIIQKYIWISYPTVLWNAPNVLP